jgi:hypothetical protein
MMSSMCLNLGSASKSLSRSLIHKPLKSNQICPIPNTQSEYWIPRKGAQEERLSECLKFNGTITPKKKRLGKPSHIFNTTFQTSFEPILKSNRLTPFQFRNLGMRFFLRGEGCAFRYLGDRHIKFLLYVVIIKVKYVLLG